MTQTEEGIQKEQGIPSTLTFQLLERKFNSFKYKPNTTTQPLTQTEEGIQKKTRNPLYSDILKRKKGNTNLKRKTSESNTLANKPTTVEQLKTLNISNKGKSQSRSTSSTNQSQEESLKQQIKQLQINYKEQAMET